jgi:threonine/homoserine/homoserine lactone efflux protein
MTSIQALIAFIAVASILVVTPGLDVALVLRTAVAGGPRPAAFASMGIALGCLLWGAAVSVGLGALLAASELAFTIVKWVGAAYLFYLGLKLMLRPRERFDATFKRSPRLNPMQSLRQGLLTNILNPKIGVFYVTFLPQFVPDGANVASFSFLLTAIHVVLGLVWFAVLIAATMPMSKLLRRPRVVQVMDRLTGGIFLLFGAKLVLAK